MPRGNKLVNWEFYYTLTEYFLAYIDDDDKNTRSTIIPITGTSNRWLEVTGAFGKRHSCEIFSMEECIIGKLFSNSNRHGRQWSQMKFHLYFCQDEQYKIVAHSCIPPKTKVQIITRFNGMSCFKMAHLTEWKNIIVHIEITEKNTE